MGMIPAKNCETVFKFVKVMPRKLVASFFPDTAYMPNTTVNLSDFPLWRRLMKCHSMIRDYYYITTTTVVIVIIVIIIIRYSYDNA